MADRRLTQIIEKLEVPHEGGTLPDRWINNDIKPIEAGRRTWGSWTFHTYCEFLFLLNHILERESDPNQRAKGSSSMPISQRISREVP